MLNDNKKTSPMISLTTPNKGVFTDKKPDSPSEKQTEQQKPTTNLIIEYSSSSDDEVVMYKPSQMKQNESIQNENKSQFGKREVDWIDNEEAPQKKRSRKEDDNSLPERLHNIIQMTINETLTAEELISKYENFEWVKRIEYEDLTDEIIDEYLFEKKEPLVISNTLVGIMHEGKPKKINPADSKFGLFSLDYLKNRVGDIELIPRDNLKIRDVERPWEMRDYVDYLRKNEQDRYPKLLYGKDIPCPHAWEDFLFQESKLQPRFIHKGEMDLMADAPKDVQAITLMVYIGDKKTHTPAHRDVVGTIGHNIMVWSDGLSLEDEVRIDESDAIMKKKHKKWTQEELKKLDTYALWCIMSPSDLPDIRKFWKEHGNDIDEDNCFIPLTYLRKAPFKVRLVEQRLGDFVILPPNAPHQVVNRGGKSVKIAWNTLTVSSIPQSILSLPSYREYGKAQVYRVKALAYYALKKRIEAKNPNLREIETLLRIVEKLAFEEYINSKFFNSSDEDIQKFPDRLAHTRTCLHCNCDIFNRCYHCEKCDKSDKPSSSSLMKGAMTAEVVPPSDDEQYHGYDLCLDCVAEGRSCQHKGEMQLREYISMKSIQRTIETAENIYLTGMTERGEGEKAQQIIKAMKTIDEHSVATIAFDIMHFLKLSDNDVPRVTCHQTKHRCHIYDTIECSNNCGTSYCGKCLWDKYLIKIGETRKGLHWICPKCKDVCNCSHCLNEKGLNLDTYKSVVLQNLPHMKDARSFIEKNIGTELEVNQLSAPSDHAPQSMSKVEQLMQFPSSSMQRKITIVNNSSQKLRIVTYTGNIREPQCKECNESLIASEVVQRRSDRATFCKSCVSKFISDIDMNEWVIYDRMCDSCHSVIIGTRFSANEFDFCHDCYTFGDIRVKNQDMQFSMVSPDFHDVSEANFI
jgi:hypothetical protein